MPTLDRIRRMAETSRFPPTSSSWVRESAAPRPTPSRTLSWPSARTLEQMVSRDELRSVIKLLDAFIATKQIDQIAKGRSARRNA